MEAREPASELDALDEMLAYHGRLRAQFDTLRTIEADLRDRGTEAILDARALAEEVMEVFGREGQLHALDEAESLFPRVRGRLTPEDAAVLDALDRLEEEHRTPSEAWPSLRAWLWMLSVPDEMVSLGQLHDARVGLEAHFIPHLELEERTIFPAARKLLDREALEQMAVEARERRARRITHDQPLMP